MNAYQFINTAHDLSMHFCEELEDISPEELLLLVHDFADARAEDNCSGAEYKRRIGEGNLRSYVDCLNINAIYLGKNT